MASLRITSFGGLSNSIAPRLAQPNVAQIAHNCLLWDGVLRPLAKWSKVQGVAFEDVASIEVKSDNSGVLTSPIKDAIFLHGLEYRADAKVGLAPYYVGAYDSNIVYSDSTTDVEGRAVGIKRPVVDPSTTINYTRSYHSDKPVNRLYALSAIRKSGNKVEESTLTLLPNQSPQSIVYEGDIANLSIVASSLTPYEYTGLRLYRSISGMDTGQDVANQLDTEWFLVAELNGTPDGINYIYTYADGGSATTDPLDLYLAAGFYPPRRNVYSHLQMLDSGWLVAASSDGDIIVSERYLYHAWPTDQWWHISDVITDAKSQGDNLFIGTRNQPYILAVASGEKLPVQGNISGYPEKYECLPGTMARSASGVMYASPSGVVSLTREGMSVLTTGVMGGVTPMYKIEREYTEVVDGETVERTKFYPMRFQHTAYGAYFKGTYFGFCKVPTTETLEGEPLYLFKGYMFVTGSSLDGDKPLQRFVTFDTPDNVRAHATGGSGMYVLSTDGVWRMPFPDSVGNELYARSPKYCYSWKSKKHVFPGEMVMAAGKVVHDCKGFVRIKIFVDCCCRYEYTVPDCQPFPLPSDLAGVEWEVQVEGTAAVHEIHLASSLRELLEQ